MADQTRLSTLDVIRHALAEKSRQLSELEVILADYHAERIRLIRDLRRLQAQLRDAEEHLRNDTHSPGVR